MKIDSYCHVMPARYKAALYEKAFRDFSEKSLHERRTTLTDWEARLRLLEEFPDVQQVLTVTIPPLEDVARPRQAAELARIANDEMAELVARYPQRCWGAVANLPMNDMKAALQEAERAIRELGFRGVQLYTSVNGKPLSSPEFFPLFELMASVDLPIWVHPRRVETVPDYPTETASLFQISSIFGWPYETTAAMTRLVFSGLLERLPHLKVITHHCGGMVPYFAKRIELLYGMGQERLGTSHFPGLTRPPIEYFRLFCNDTAVSGSAPALMCGYTFFGADHLLFGTDMPYDVENGRLAIKRTIESVEGMLIPEADKDKIYQGNAIRLLRLSP